METKAASLIQQSHGLTINWLKLYFNVSRTGFRYSLVDGVGPQLLKDLLFSSCRTLVTSATEDFA